MRAPPNGSSPDSPFGAPEPSALRFELTLTPEQLDELVELVAQRLGGAPAVDGWLRGADRIAEYIDAPVSRVYALAGSTGRIPVERDGSNLIARRSDLDRWLHDGGGKRP